MPAIVVGRVADIEPLHCATQISLRGFEDQMVMVRHEAVGMDSNRKLPAHSLQAGKKTLAITIIVKNRILSLPTIHNVVKRTRIFNTQRPCHNGIIAGLRRLVNA